MYSSRTADKFVVRLPDGMRERIADVARSHHRSMNSEIIHRLEKSISAEEGDAGSLEEKIQRLSQRDRMVAEMLIDKMLEFPKD